MGDPIGIRRGTRQALIDVLGMACDSLLCGSAARDRSQIAVFVDRYLHQQADAAFQDCTTLTSPPSAESWRPNGFVVHGSAAADDAFLMEELAKHAPPVPSWFKADTEKHGNPPEIEPPTECPEGVRKTLASWRKDPCFDPEPEKIGPPGMLWVEEWRAWWKERDRIDEVKKIQRLAQWPWAYAKLVMDARPKGGK